MFPVRTLAGGINITDRVTATLIKDGKVIKRFVGVKMHNKWQTGANGGLAVVMNLLRAGATAAGAGQAHTMWLGSQCSDTGWTVIAASDESTTNNEVSSTQVKFEATWAAAGAISNICQAMIQIYGYTGTGTTKDAAIYNFTTQFTKPDGVSLKIEWTTSLTS